MSIDFSPAAICVFCGANGGFDPAYLAAADECAAALVDQQLKLVYGGGSVGMMGQIADGVIKRGGHVTGVIPHFLATKELLHEGVQDLRLVESMHQRKGLMAELSGGFIAMPGGLGTFEELFEVLTWTQLGVIVKPIGLLNTCGYFDPLMALLQHTAATGFCRREHLELCVIDDNPHRLLQRMRMWQPPGVRKWLAQEET